MIVIGIDQSFHSTGITILEDDKEPIYYIITSHLTKKQKLLNFSRLHYIEYNKTNDIRNNLRLIGEAISKIIKQYKPQLISFEAVAYSAVGRVTDLGMLCGYISALCDFYNIPYITTPPTSVKKFATGNGQCTKDTMVYSWGLLDPVARDYLSRYKIDDIADSYFMGQLGRVNGII